jgi:flagellar hook protein FlgE
MLQSTGRNMDLAIQGDGFFVFDKGDNRRYSREGSLTLDSSGYLINASTGQRAQGWQAGAAGVDTNLPTNDIRIESNHTMARATGAVVLGGNLSADTPIGDRVTTTMGVYDSLGDLRTVTVQFTRASDYGWSWTLTDPNDPTQTGTLTFNTAGQLAAEIPAASLPSIRVPGSTATNPITFTMNPNNLTMLTTGDSIAVKTQDGLPTGTVSDVFITPKDGSVFLVYSNGMRAQVAQLAVARFTNPSGLIRAGHTAFQQGLNSGEAEIGTAGTGGRGTIAAGYLEASNVDMAQEFTNMILAQRGFQASSRVITTSDEIMQELVNLKR